MQYPLVNELACNKDFAEMSVLRLQRLRCEYLINPIGLDTREPRLSWQIESETRGAAQTAYEISVATSPELLLTDASDLWSSGRVESDQSVHVVYAGAALSSRLRCYWRVRVWDQRGHASTWSEVNYWEMGLLDSEDWRAYWIRSSMVGTPVAEVPSPYLKLSFTVDKPLRAARQYVTALGLYEIHINNQKVGDEVLTPGWTDYRKRLLYQTYDVTHHIVRGWNVVGAILADGWYCGHVAWERRQSYGDRPALLAQLALDYADGTTEWIVTDERWHYRFGPLFRADLLMGETYDKRLELEDWQNPSSPLAGWTAVEKFTAAEVPLKSGTGLAVRRQAELESISTKRHGETYWIFDLGQNFAGRVRIQASAKKGTTLTIRHAETLDEKGWPYTANLRTATARDSVTLCGTANEVWEPRFTFHGFRYVEVKSSAPLEGDPLVTGIVLHSPLPRTGLFECSNSLINQLQHNIQWGLKSNFLEVPTDCPQRDERLGWTGDAQVFIRTAAFNANVAPFFTKWQNDILDSQHPSGAVPCVAPNFGMGSTPDNPGIDGGPAWADATVVCPWTIYLCYGDRRILEQHYNSMSAYGDYLHASSHDGRRCDEGAKYFRGYGDWLAWDGSGDNEGGTPKELIGTAFYAWTSGLLERIARVLGHEPDAVKFASRFHQAKAAFQREFLSPGGRLVSGTQTSAVLALHFDLLPPSLRGKVLTALVDDIRKKGNHLSTGFVGTPYLASVLSANGRLDVAFDLLHQRTWPSWLYSVTQGATTIWERWNGWTHDQGFADVGMNSFNHYAYGAIGEWLYSTVAGLDIDPSCPGYKHVVIRPQPGGNLSFARASLETMYGPVESGWKLEEGHFFLDVRIPPNTTGEMHLPASLGHLLTEGGRPLATVNGVNNVTTDEHGVFCHLASGVYKFVSRL